MGDSRPKLVREIDLESSAQALEEALDHLFQARPAGRPIHMLEVGCGDGRVSRLIFQRFARACGGPSAVRLSVLDIDMERVAQAAPRLLSAETAGCLHLLRGDMYHLPFPAAGFDFVVALNVFFWAERQRILAEAARVLKPEGRMLVSDLIPRPSFETKRPLITLHLSREQILGGPARS